MREAKKKKAKKWKKKNEYTPFPPPQQPSKIDLQIESGEYFLNERARHKQKQDEIKSKQVEKQQKRKEQRASLFIPPQEKLRTKSSISEQINAEVDVKKLKTKAKKIQHS